MKVSHIFLMLCLMASTLASEREASKEDPCGSMIQIPPAIKEDLNLLAYDTKNPDLGVISEFEQLTTDDILDEHDDDNEMVEIDTEENKQSIFSQQKKSLIFETSMEDFFKLNSILIQDEAAQGGEATAAVEDSGPAPAEQVETPVDSGVATPVDSGAAIPADSGTATPAGSGADTPVDSGTTTPVNSGAEMAAGGAVTGTQASSISPVEEVESVDDLNLPDPDVITIKDVLGKFEIQVDAIDKVVTEGKNGMLGALHEASTAIQTNIEKTIDDLNKMYDKQIKSVVKIVDKINYQTRQEIRKKAIVIIDKLLKVQDRLDQTLEQTMRAEIDYLRPKLEEKKQIIGETEKRIEDLQTKLPPPESFCNMYTDCQTCTANSKCGWCETQEFCMPGDRTAPTNDICKQWDYGVCRKMCGKHDRCSDCLTSPQCGWCAQTFQCLSEGANYDQCGNDFYHSNSDKDECPTPNKDYIDDLQKMKAEKAKREESISSTLNNLTQEEKEINAEQKELAGLKLKKSHYEEELEAQQALYDKLKGKMDKFESCLKSKFGDSWKQKLQKEERMD